MRNGQNLVDVIKQVKECYIIQLSVNYWLFRDHKKIVFDILIFCEEQETGYLTTQLLYLVVETHIDKVSRSPKLSDILFPLPGCLLQQGKQILEN